MSNLSPRWLQHYIGLQISVPALQSPSWVSTTDSQSTAGTFNGVVTVIICKSYLIKRGTATAGKVSENRSSSKVETQQSSRSRKHAERNITGGNTGETGKTGKYNVVEWMKLSEVAKNDRRGR